MTTSVILTGFVGRSVPSFRGSASSASRISSPPTSLPKTVCFLSRWGHGLNVLFVPSSQYLARVLSANLRQELTQRIATHCCLRLC